MHYFRVTKMKHLLCSLFISFAEQTFVHFGLKAECFDCLVMAQCVQTLDPASHQLAELEVNSRLAALSNRCVQPKRHAVIGIILKISLELYLPLLHLNGNKALKP